MRCDEYMRIVGSISVILGYFVVLHISPIVGVCINLVGDMVSVPYFIRTKSWDVVVMIFFLSVISTSKLVAG